MTLADLQSEVVANSQLSIVGSRKRFAADAYLLDITGYSGIVEHDADDQVVVVRAGTRLAELNSELGKVGQTVPLVDPLGTETLGGAIAMNLPHLLEAQHGSWRDWVIGMTLILGDGSIAKCGSKAVKNVAGYDVQKLLLGSRGQLALIAEVILRTTPTAAVQSPDVVEGSKSTFAAIQRVLRSDFNAALESNSAQMRVADQQTSTLWLTSTDGIARFGSDWMIYLDRRSPQEGHLDLLDAKLKATFDPQSRFI